jgi:beta propeller repeat protein
VIQVQERIGRCVATGALAGLAVLVLSGHEAPLRAQTAPPITWTETRLSDDPADQFEAAVRDGKVAWVDLVGGGADIQLYDLGTGQLRQITSDPAAQFDPRLEGDWVVYADSRNDLGDVYAFNLATGVETLLTTDAGRQQQPAISGDRVVWSSFSPSGVWDVYGRSLLGGPIFYVVLGPRVELNPRISGDLVVWEELSQATGSWDVRVLDLATYANQILAAGPENERDPDIDGTRIVYVRYHSDNSNADVMLYDVASGLTTQLTATPALRRRPRISGHTVVWYEGPPGDWDARGHDLLSGTELPLAVGPAMSLLPDIDGHDVVITDDRNGDFDVYRLVLNRPPVADAGPDQELEATSPDGALVTLDGSASSDGDGDPLSFTWSGPFGTRTGAVASVLMPPGTHPISLTVEDGWGGSASDLLDVTVSDASPCPHEYVETFDAYGAAADPPGWVDFKARRGAWIEAEGFRTVLAGATIAYQAQRARRASEYRTSESLGWRDYEWSGSFELPRGRKREGPGFLVYSDLAAGRSYRIRYDPKHDRRAGFRLLGSGGGSLDGRTHTGVAPRSGATYRFRIRVEGEPEATHIRARFWHAERVEPSEWMIDARDASEPLRSGAIAVTASAPGTRFDDFHVLALAGAESGISGDADGDGACDAEDAPPSPPDPCSGCGS